MRSIKKAALPSFGNPAIISSIYSLPTFRPVALRFASEASESLRGLRKPRSFAFFREPPSLGPHPFEWFTLFVKIRGYLKDVLFFLKKQGGKGDFRKAVSFILPTAGFFSSEGQTPASV